MYGLVRLAEFCPRCIGSAMSVLTQPSRSSTPHDSSMHIRNILSGPFLIANLQWDEVHMWSEVNTWKGSLMAYQVLTVLSSESRRICVSRNILRDLATSYGKMILVDGFFQADPHPGNVLINKRGKASTHFPDCFMSWLSAIISVMFFIQSFLPGHHKFEPSYYWPQKYPVLVSISCEQQLSSNMP